MKWKESQENKFCIETRILANKNFAKNTTRRQTKYIIKWKKKIQCNRALLIVMIFFYFVDLLFILKTFFSHAKSLTPLIFNTRKPFKAWNLTQYIFLFLEPTYHFTLKFLPRYIHFIEKKYSNKVQIFK